MQILVTGGAGYIGTHTCVELVSAGHDVIVVDNLANSRRRAVGRVEEIVGGSLRFYEIDLLDKASLSVAFEESDIEAVIHFAGLKAVGESAQKPLEYYRNNVGGTAALCDVMEAHDVRNMVFSSSATVYGNPQSVPIREDFPLEPANPYGRSKLMIEMLLQDLQAANDAWNVVVLRYFNPVGAHESGLIGEDPKGVPNNLLPFVAQVAVGHRSELIVFGDDYETPDGTGVRDYIHVTDLALGHLKALERLSSNPGAAIYNLGTGRGYSVLEMIKAFEEASGRRVPFRIAGRRAGDVAVCFADPSLAREELGWSAHRDVEQMCADAWLWQSQNPNGYA